MYESELEESDDRTCVDCGDKTNIIFVLYMMTSIIVHVVVLMDMEDYSEWNKKIH